MLLPNSGYLTGGTRRVDTGLSWVGMSCGLWRALSPYHCPVLNSWQRVPVRFIVRWVMGWRGAGGDCNVFE
jgi:hypothetical protein